MRRKSQGNNKIRGGKTTNEMWFQIC